MSANKFQPDADYWNQKLANYLHDPPDKALSIPGHEERSRNLTDLLNVPTPDRDVYQRADMIASGMDRAQVPGYHTDPAQNGAIDFLKKAFITHPTGNTKGLQIELPTGTNKKDMDPKLTHIIEADLNKLSQHEAYKNNHQQYAAARFHYVHHVWRERLAQENVGGLGGLWYRMPADTRIPDHSIWQHCALVSALTSCFALSEKKQASLMVFNLTPVQDFIGRARKLRDFWTGSIILSWLAFEGIRQIIYAFGSDHVIYPSLIGQPMVNQLFANELKFEASWLDSASSNHATGVASFPNKFVCLVPTGQEQAITQDIQSRIQKAWLELGNNVLEMVEKRIKRQDAVIRGQFDRQLQHFWDFHWSACPLLEGKSQEIIKQLLSKDVWGRVLDFLDRSKALPFQTKGEGAFYSITHALTQSFLAAGKSRRHDHREEEPGIKCSLHGDLEALHSEWKNNDKNPRPDHDPFWQYFKEVWEPKSDFKGSERLSAVALIKRLAYRACKEMPGHPLKPFFDRADSFPSSTEIALTDWLDRVEMRKLHQELKEDWRKKLAQVIHEQEEDNREQRQGAELNDLNKEDRPICRRIIEAMGKAGDPVRDEDKYYAILMMDGDHMGRLVNGETLASTWKTVLHPDLAERLRNPSFLKNFRTFWQAELGQIRLLAPGVHAAISEALGDFSLYTVPEIIERYRGRLIYAGGDDVCAVLPVSTAIPAAREIAQRYGDNFIFIPKVENELTVSQPVSQSWRPAPGRLALHLGKGENISISAGLLVNHHKKPLDGAMRRAHELLDLAKLEGGRNALVLELAKRSGESRLFITQWQEQAWEALQVNEPIPTNDDTLLSSFLQAGSWLGHSAKKSLSTSLVYRLKEFETGLEAIINQRPADLAQFLQSQILRSGTSIKEKDQTHLAIARQMSALIARWRPEKNRAEVDAKALIIARFIGSCMARASKRQGGNS
jgi:CRISPR-associated protein Cmr2